MARRSRGGCRFGGVGNSDLGFSYLDCVPGGTPERMAPVHTEAAVVASPDASRSRPGMTDTTVTLDERRGMMAQKATEIRRQRAEIEADQAAVRKRREDLEAHLLDTPAATWAEAIERARYLLALFAETSEGRDPRHRKLIAGLLDDFTRLSGEPDASNGHLPTGHLDDPEVDT